MNPFEGGLVDAKGNSAHVRQPQVEIPKNFIPVITLGVGPGSITLFPDENMAAVGPGGMSCQRAFYFEHGVIYKVTHFQCYGLPIAVEYSKKPEWWDRRKEAKHGSWTKIPKNHEED